MENVIDLDILRPDKKFVKLGGETIDVSFIPVGIVFEVEEITRELSKVRDKDIKKGREETRRAFDLTVKLVSTYTAFSNPAMTDEWVRRNCDASQIKLFAEAVKESLFNDYKGVERYGKN